MVFWEADAAASGIPGIDGVHSDKAEAALLDWISIDNAPYTVILGG